MADLVCQVGRTVSPVANQQSAVAKASCQWISRSSLVPVCTSAPVAGISWTGPSLIAKDLWTPVLVNGKGLEPVAGCRGVRKVLER